MTVGGFNANRMMGYRPQTLQFGNQKPKLSQRELEQAHEQMEQERLKELQDAWRVADTFAKYMDQDRFSVAVQNVRTMKAFCRDGALGDTLHHFSPEPAEYRLVVRRRFSPTEWKSFPIGEEFKKVKNLPGSVSGNGEEKPPILVLGEREFKWDISNIPELKDVTQKVFSICYSIKVWDR